MSWTVLGISFHAYGLLIGLGVFIATSFGESLAKQQNISLDEFWKMVWAGVAGGVVGARSYHVLTDWWLYSAEPWRALFLWQGGLSIIGGVAGGVLAIFLAQRVFKTQLKALVFLDMAALSLPLGQMVGRLGNWANQELYGLPSSLPWAIPIDAQHRLVGYQQYSHFHPLFAYEIVGLALLFGVLWRSYQQDQKKLGQGKLLVLYVTGYASLRFLLEFLRIDKSMLLGTGLGVNQMIMLITAVLGSLLLGRRHWFKAPVLLLAAFVMTSCTQLPMAFPVTVASPPPPAPLSLTPTQLQKIPDRSKLSAQVGQQQLTVEVVNTSASMTQGLSGRSQIGSDGMLFVLGQPRVATFWMKEMKFNLDLVWIYNDKIIGISQNVPAPKTASSPLTLYSSPDVATMVLEVPAGTAATLQWQAGTSVTIQSANAQIGL